MMLVQSQEDVKINILYYIVINDLSGHMIKVINAFNFPLDRSKNKYQFLKANSRNLCNLNLMLGRWFLQCLHKVGSNQQLHKIEIASQQTFINVYCNFQTRVEDNIINCHVHILQPQQLSTFCNVVSSVFPVFSKLLKNKFQTP